MGAIYREWKSMLAALEDESLPDKAVAILESKELHALRMHL